MIGRVPAVFVHIIFVRKTIILTWIVHLLRYALGTTITIARTFDLFPISARKHSNLGRVPAVLVKLDLGGFKTMIVTRIERRPRLSVTQQECLRGPLRTVGGAVAVAAAAIMDDREGAEKETSSRDHHSHRYTVLLCCCHPNLT